jgi:hypothetical protein
MFLYSYIGVGRPITKEVEDGHGGGSDCKVVGLTLCSNSAHDKISQ